MGGESKEIGSEQISRNYSFLRGGGGPDTVGATWLISRNSSFLRGGGGDQGDWSDMTYFQEFFIF